MGIRLGLGLSQIRVRDWGSSCPRTVGFGLELGLGVGVRAARGRRRWAAQLWSSATRRSTIHLFMVRVKLRVKLRILWVRTRVVRWGQDKEKNRIQMRDEDRDDTKVVQLGVGRTIGTGSDLRQAGPPFASPR